MAKGLGVTLTKIPTSSIADSSIGITNIVTTGSASASTFLKGDYSWGTVSASGKINVVASDPSTNTAGDIWYADGKFKFTSDLTSLFGIWTAGGNNTTSLQYPANGTGTLDAGLFVSGWGTGVAYSAATSEYNGFTSTWTSVTAVPEANISGGGFGVQSAAVTFAGVRISEPRHINVTTNEWSGSAWTSGGSYPDNRNACKGGGIASSGLGTGGTSNPATSPTNTQVRSYDGTSWSESTSLNWGTNSHGCTGSSASSIMVMGGDGDPDGSQSYNGTSWTTQNDMIRNSAAECGASGSGVNSAMTFGGSPATDLTTIEFDGTSWSTTGLHVTARYGCFGTGSASAALMSGGNNAGSTMTSTEEYRKPVMKFIGT